MSWPQREGLSHEKGGPHPKGGVQKRMLDFGQFNFGQLAEVEIGRSRTHGVCSFSSFSFLFSSSSLSFLFLVFFFFFFLFFLFFIFVFLFLSANPEPQTPKPQNPKPQNLNPKPNPPPFDLLRKVGISRVSVKASPAFGRRRLHTNTDHIDCPTQTVFFPLFSSFSSFFSLS